MKSKAWDYLAYGTIAVFCLFLILGAGYGLACAKAAAYERVTGKHVSPWDAFILDLKVHQ